MSSGAMPHTTPRDVVRVAREARACLYAGNSVRAIGLFVRGVRIWGDTFGQPTSARERAFRCLLAVKAELFAGVVMPAAGRR